MLHGVMLRALLHRRVSYAWSCAAVRTQRMPGVILGIGDVRTPILHRSRGAITGNRLAAVFGRIVMEDILEFVWPSLRDLSWQIQPSLHLRPHVWPRRACVDLRGAPLKSTLFPPRLMWT